MRADAVMRRHKTAQVHRRLMPVFAALLLLALAGPGWRAECHHSAGACQRRCARRPGVSGRAFEQALPAGMRPVPYWSPSRWHGPEICWATSRVSWGGRLARRLKELPIGTALPGGTREFLRRP